MFGTEMKTLHKNCTFISSIRSCTSTGLNRAPHHTFKQINHVIYSANDCGFELTML